MKTIIEGLDFLKTVLKKVKAQKLLSVGSNIVHIIRNSIIIIEDGKIKIEGSK